MLGSALIAEEEGMVLVGGRNVSGDSLTLASAPMAEEKGM